MRIENSVIVVTGASSGIGRATAVELARRGAKLVLVARREDVLAEVARECGGEGVLVAPADVSDAAAVERVAERAVAEFGRIDGWVNNAGVTMFGRLVDVPLDDVRRVLDVNLMGQVHGARAALPRMIAQGSGVLVNVSSILGVIAQPYGSAYTMSKFAVRGLSISLREELRLSGVKGVHVSTVLPAAIDTPVYASAANHSGRRVGPPPPVYRPERVAATIVAQLRRPRRQVVSGGVLGRLFVAQHRLAPGLTEYLLGREVDLTLRRSDPPVPATSGSLYEPAPGPTTPAGGWHGLRRERVRTAALVLAAVGVTAGVTAGAARR
jgi:short-subunit dehydrogenase